MPCRQGNNLSGRLALRRGPEDTWIVHQQRRGAAEDLRKGDAEHTSVILVFSFVKRQQVITSGVED